MITLEEIVTQIGYTLCKLDNIPPGRGYPDGARFDDLKHEVKKLAGCCLTLCKTLMEKEK